MRLRLGQPVETTDGPFGELADAELGGTRYDDLTEVNCDRIPKGECEIRRRSDVTTSDDRLVGHVEGFLAEDDHLTGVVVRTGLAGFRHDVLVPMAAVGKVRSDWIRLAIDKAAFAKLQPVDGFTPPGAAGSRVDAFEQRAGRLVRRGRNALTTRVGELRSALRRGQD